MSDQNTTTTNKKKVTPFFYIAFVLGAILSILMLIGLSKELDYSFMQGLGFGVACFFIVAIIFGGAAMLVDTFLKIIVELFVVLLLLFNVAFIMYIWASKHETQNVVLEMGIGSDSNISWVYIIAFAIMLFIIDVLFLLIIYPMVRAADSGVIDQFTE